MKRYGVILVLLLLVPLISNASDWKTYPYTDPNTEIVFPTDEGSHSSSSLLEWWYVVIHAVGQTTGDKYSILITHFNNEFRFFTVTNVTQETHESGTTVGVLISQEGHLNLTHSTVYGTDYLRTKTDAYGNLVPFEYEFETKYSDMNINGELISLKRPLIVGGDGYVEIGSSGYSWYYSLTRMDVNAVLTYGGITENITGLAWIDHQWGPFLVSPVELGGLFETYEWYCVQLDDGSEIMISTIFDRDYNLPDDEAYGGVEISDINGNTITGLPFTFTRTGYWQDPVSGYYMSMGWTLAVPSLNLNLILTPEFKEQMVSFPLGGDFWEGSIAVSGTSNGTPITGRAFGELIHRFEIPDLSVTVKNYPLKIIYRTNDKITVNWAVNNPDDGNPLKYDVDLVSGTTTISIAKDITANTVTYTLGTTVPWGSFVIKVTANSVDKVIQGNENSPILFKI